MRMTSLTLTAWMEESSRQSKPGRRVRKVRVKVGRAEVAQAIAVVVVAAAAAVVVVRAAVQAAVREVTVVAIPAAAVVDAVDGKNSSQYSVLVSSEYEGPREVALLYFGGLRVCSAIARFRQWSEGRMSRANALVVA